MIGICGRIEKGTVECADLRMFSVFRFQFKHRLSPFNTCSVGTGGIEPPRFSAAVSEAAMSASFITSRYGAFDRTRTCTIRLTAGRTSVDATKAFQADFLSDLP